MNNKYISNNAKDVYKSCVCNKYNLNFFLNIAVDFDCFILSGITFHIIGPWTLIENVPVLFLPYIYISEIISLSCAVISIKSICDNFFIKRWKEISMTLDSLVHQYTR